MSNRIISRQIPLALTLIVGMILTTDWFVEWEPIQYLSGNFLNFHIIISAFMMGFGAVNLYILHISRIKRNFRDKNFFEVSVSTILLSCILIWVIVGIFLGTKSSEYEWLYATFNTPLSATASAMTMFYVASASYRVLRFKNKETSVLLLVAIFTFMANTPLIVTYIPQLQIFRAWTENILVKASYRAITIGVGLGAILLGLRTLLGREAGYLGATGE